MTNQTIKRNIRIGKYNPIFMETQTASQHKLSLILPRVKKHPTDKYFFQLDTQYHLKKTDVLNILKISYWLETSSPFAENVSFSKYAIINFFRAIVKSRTNLHWTRKNILHVPTLEAIAVLHRKKYNSPLEDKLKLWKAAIHLGRAVKSMFA